MSHRQFGIYIYMSKKNMWSRCHIRGGGMHGQGFDTEMSMRYLHYGCEKQLHQKKNTILDIDNGELQKKKKNTRGETEQLRKRNEEDRERNSKTTLGLARSM